MDTKSAIIDGLGDLPLAELIEVREQMDTAIQNKARAELLAAEEATNQLRQLAGLKARPIPKDVMTPAKKGRSKGRSAGK